MSDWKKIARGFFCRFIFNLFLLCHSRLKLFSCLFLFLVEKRVNKFSMICFKFLTDQPGFFFKTEINSFMIGIKMTNFIPLLNFSIFLLGDSGDFNFILVYLELSSLLSFFIIFTWECFGVIFIINWVDHRQILVFIWYTFKWMNDVLFLTRYNTKYLKQILNWKMKFEERYRKAGINRNKNLS